MRGWADGDQVFEVTRYRIDAGQFNYMMANDETQSVDVAEVDWMKTSQLNLSKSPTVPAGSVLTLAARADQDEAS